MLRRDPRHRWPNARDKCRVSPDGGTTNNPDPRDQPMLDRIDMDVMNMPREIIFVANGVLPSAAARRRVRLRRRGCPKCVRRPAGCANGRFDQTPARGKIRVGRGQRPDRVETIGQHSHRIDRERMRPPRLAKYAAQESSCCVSNRSPRFVRLSVKKKLPRRGTCDV
jgi:hypothetical protein